MYWSACAAKWTCVSLCFVLFFLLKLCSSVLPCLFHLFCVFMCLCPGVWSWLWRWLPGLCVGVCFFALRCKLMHTHFAVSWCLCQEMTPFCVCVSLYEYMQVICALTAMISATFLLCSVYVCACVCEVGVSGAPAVRLHWPLCYCSLIINYGSPHPEKSGGVEAYVEVIMNTELPLGQ